jgi:protein-disulfide isomerase
MEESKENKVESNSGKNYWKYATYVLVLAVVGIIAFNLGGGSTGGVVDNTIPNNPTVPSAPVKVDIDDDSIKGDKNAPVTIVEFSDYECPFCARFYSQTLSQIDENYIKTGKVRLVYRDFPLSIHPQAQKAAEAAECAGEQDKYYDMHNILFEKGVSGGVTSFKQYASEIGLDTAKFNSCLDSGKMASEVQKDFQDGQSYGVRGTPAFFINGQLVSGAQPYANFEAAIEAALKAA